MKMKKRFLGILLTLALVLGLIPGMSLTAFAASPTAAQVLAPTMDDGKVLQAKNLIYAGKEWIVVGVGDTGVQLADGAVSKEEGETTLVLLAYNNWSSSYVKFANTESNDYATSNLRTLMEGYVTSESIGSYYTGSQAWLNDLVAPRTLEGGATQWQTGYEGWQTEDKILGTTITDATLWPMSAAERQQVYAYRMHPNYRVDSFWLRTPAPVNEGDVRAASSQYINYVQDDWVQYGNCAGVRPALCLNVTDDMFVTPTEGSVEYTYELRKHDFGYTASGATLTAQCSSSVCELNGETFNLTISASDVDYDGSTYAGASISDTTDWTAMGLAVPTIQYEGTGSTTYAKSATAPTDAGTYVATISAGGATASAAFSIVAPHTHSFTYTPGTGEAVNTVTATCTGEGECDYKTNGITLTLTAPTSLTYDGTAKEATISGYPTTAPTGLAEKPTKVTYYKSTGAGSTTTSGDALSGAPTNADNYVAQMTWGKKTASVTFTIAKATPVAADFSFTAPGSLTYDGNAKEATVVPADGVDGMGTIAVHYYSDAQRTEEVETSKVKNAGTYYVGITTAEGSNYAATTERIFGDVWSFTIAPKSVTVTGITADNKEYDGNTVATLNSKSAVIQGKVEGDNLSFSSAKGSFLDKNVGEDKTVTITGLTLTGDNATNYTLASQPANVKANITAKEVTVSGITASNKVYDGSTDATLNFTSAEIQGKVGSDALSIDTNSVKGSFSNSNVGDGKTVTISGLVLTGNDSNNYTLANQPTATANITTRGVTVSGITASDKTYDGTTDATLVTTNASFDGKLGSDALSVSATGTFDNASVGENKTVTISGLTLGGDSKDNYVLADKGQQTGATAAIKAKEVGLSWSNTELTYNGKAQKPTATATGLKDGDSCTVTVTGEQTNAGDDYTATADSLSNSNYKLPENKTTTFKISKANAVAATVNANDRTYDGTEKPLVTVTGEATGGEMQYALGTDATTAPTDGWGVEIPNGKEAKTYYVWYKVVGDPNHNNTDPACVTVTISQKPSGGGSGGGDTPTEYTIPVTSEETVPVKAEIKDGNAAVGEISKEALDKAIGDGTNSEGTVNVDLSGAKQEVTSVELTKQSVENLADAAKADNGIDSATIKMTDSIVELDAKALQAVSDQAKGDDIKLVVDDFDKKELNEKQTEALKQYTAASIFEAFFESNGVRIHDLNGGKATVSRKLAPAAGTSADNYHLVYLNPNGLLEWFLTWLQNGWLSSDLTHFSEYAIVYDESKMNDNPAHATYEGLTDAEKADAQKLAEAFGVSKDTAAQMLKTGQSLGVSLDTMLLSTAAIGALPDDNDPAGTDFAKLTARATKRGAKTMTLQWKTVPQADGYMVYTNQCGKTKKMKLKKTFTKNTYKKWKMTKLKKQKYYKSMVVAYKIVGDQKLPIAASVVVHCTTKAKKSTVAKGVKVNKKKVTVAVGQTAKLKGKEIKAEKKKTIKRHRVVCYESLNPEIATVDKKTGKITGVAAGTTTVYVYAQNGVFKKIPVTVQ